MLPACLESLAGVADEIHVRNTGSVNGTPELAGWPRSAGRTPDGPPAWLAERPGVIDNAESDDLHRRAAFWRRLATAHERWLSQQR
jgi:hypothetical protein